MRNKCDKQLATLQTHACIEAFVQLVSLVRSHMRQLYRAVLSVVSIYLGFEMWKKINEKLKNCSHLQANTLVLKYAAATY